MFYRLNGTEAVKCEFEEMEKFLGKGRDNNIVGQQKVGEKIVSTVFLCVDHSGGIGEPQLFETVVLNGLTHDRVIRYSNWEAAEAGHRATLREEQAKHDKQTIEQIS